MNRLHEIELMRLLHGELPPERARELEERLASTPELAEELRRLDEIWGRLELPPAAPTPRGFARSVVARATGGGLWSVAPTRIRAAAVGMLAAGLALGVGLATGLSRLGGASGGPAAVVASSPAAPAQASSPTTVPPSSPTAPSPELPETTGGPVDEASIPRLPSSGVPEPIVAPPTSEQMATLDYDLPADDGTYGAQGTLADDFWAAFDGSDTAANGNASGSGSEDL